MQRYLGWSSAGPAGQSLESRAGRRRVLREKGGGEILRSSKAVEGKARWGN